MHVQSYLFETDWLALYKLSQLTHSLPRAHTLQILTMTSHLKPSADDPLSSRSGSGSSHRNLGSSSFSRHMKYNIFTSFAVYSPLQEWRKVCQQRAQRIGPFLLSPTPRASWTFSGYRSEETSNSAATMDKNFQNFLMYTPPEKAEFRIERTMQSRGYFCGAIRHH